MAAALTDKDFLTDEDFQDQPETLTDADFAESSEPKKEDRVQRRIDTEYDALLKKMQDLGINPALHPTLAASAGLVNKAINLNPEDVATLAGENSLLGLGRYITRPINAAIRSKMDNIPFGEAWDQEKQRAVNIAEAKPEANIGAATLMNIGIGPKMIEKGAETGGKIFGSLGNLLRNRANLAAVRSAQDVGMDEAALASLNKVKGQKGLSDLGEKLLKEKAVGWTKSPQRLLKVGQEVKKRGSQGMNEVYRAIDKTGKRYFYPEKYVDEIKKLVNFDPENTNALLDPEMRMASKVISALKSEGIAPKTLEEAQRLKDLTKPLTAYDKANPSYVQDTARKIERVLAKGIQEGVETGSKNIGNNELLNQFLNAKKDFGFGSKIIGPTGKATKLAKETLNQVLPGSREATNIEPVRKFLGESLYGAAKLPFKMAESAVDLYKNPGALKMTAGGFQGLEKITNLLKSSPQAMQTLGKFGPPLMQAMQRGPQAVNVTHYLLQEKDPEYRKLMDQIENNEQGGF